LKIAHISPISFFEITLSRVVFVLSQSVYLIASINKYVSKFLVPIPVTLFGKSLIISSYCFPFLDEQQRIYSSSA